MSRIFRKRGPDLDHTGIGRDPGKIEEEQVMSDGRPSVFITDSRHAPRAMEMAGMVYDGEISLAEVGFVSWKPSRSALRAPFVYPNSWMCWEAATGCCFLLISTTS